MTPLELAKQVPEERWHYVGETGDGCSGFWDPVTGILCYRDFITSNDWPPRYTISEKEDDVAIPSVYESLVAKGEVV